MGLVKEATDETFDALVVHSPLPVLVDFWAPWCRPCRLLAPTLDQIASTFRDQIQVVKVNTDENRALVSRYDIRGLPTVMVFARGAVWHSAMGVRPKEEYIRVLKHAVEG